MKYPEDEKRFQRVLKELNLTAYDLADEIEYLSKSGLYQIGKSRPMPLKLARKIVLKYPQINLLYLTKQSDSVLVRGVAQKNQVNLIAAHNAITDKETEKMFKTMYKAILLVQEQQQEIIQLLKAKG